jgi:hypothetical protein
LVWRACRYACGDDLQLLLRFQRDAVSRRWSRAGVDSARCDGRRVDCAGLCRTGIVLDSKVYAALNANNEAACRCAGGDRSQPSSARGPAGRVEPAVNDPASTNELDDVFVYYCCTAPAFSCATPSHESRERAVEEARAMMSGRGYSACTPRAYYSARTGAKQ